MTKSQITRLQLVMVPASDQDRSLAFYEALGFETRLDVPWVDGHRWIEVYPPGSEAGLALVPSGPGVVAGAHLGVILNTRDIDAAHAELASRGVDVDPQIARDGSPARIRLGDVEQAGPVPAMFWFRDPDGTQLLVVEAP